MYKKRGRKPKKPSKEFFNMIYYNQNITAEELAKEWGVKKQTIYNWACKYRKEDV